LYQKVRKSNYCDYFISEHSFLYKNTQISLSNLVLGIFLSVFWHLGALAVEINYQLVHRNARKRAARENADTFGWALSF